MYLPSLVFQATAAVKEAAGSSAEVKTAAIATPGLSAATGLPYASCIRTLNVCGRNTRPRLTPSPETTAPLASNAEASTTNVTEIFASPLDPPGPLEKIKSTSYAPLTVGVNATTREYAGTKPAAASSADGGSTSTAANSPPIANSAGAFVASALNESKGASE